MVLMASTILSESVLVLKVTELVGLPALSTEGLPSLSTEPSKVSCMLMVRPSMFTLLEARFMLMVSPFTVTVNSASWPGV